jgi:tetratricopeptide (TPR) repeat protein
MVLGLGKSQTEKNREWSDKSDNYYDMGQFEKAIEGYSKAISFDSKDYVSFDSKGLALTQLERYEESIKQFDEALGIDSTSHVVWYHKGKSFYFLKKYKISIECFNEAIKREPKHSDSWYWKAMSFYELEENEEFMRCSKKLQDFDSDIDPNYEDKIQKIMGEIKSKSSQAKESEKVKPLNVLKMRLAKGEISLDEFNELKDILEYQ